MTGASSVPPDAAGAAMSPLLQPLLRQVGLPPLPDPTGALAQATVSGVSCDSRRVAPGSLFVGLPGTAVDGGSFWPEVLAAGAVAAVIGPT
ncbi:Mur ligase domain-containing protein, partial [Cyanobium gracile UHCC 0281]|nr:Mur ligase domain-containing protein [Cyanobium gracile UHCC 0281]